MKDWILDRLRKIDATAARDQGISLVAGLLILVALYWIVRGVLHWLRKRGQIYEEFDRGRRGIGLTHRVAAIEQLLVFLGTVAAPRISPEVLAAAVGGWLVLKGIHPYGRWAYSEEAVHTALVDSKIREKAERHKLAPELYVQALARNQFLVFAIGTAMSIAAGALAGGAYHGFLSLLQM